MAKSTLENLENMRYDLTATQITFVLNVVDLLRSGKGIVESLTYLLQLHTKDYEDRHLDYELEGQKPN